jgi:hypothetical protein
MAMVRLGMVVSSAGAPRLRFGGGNVAANNFSENAVYNHNITKINKGNTLYRGAARTINPAGLTHANL